MPLIVYTAKASFLGFSDLKDDWSGPYKSPRRLILTARNIEEDGRVAHVDDQDRAIVCA